MKSSPPSVTVRQKEEAKVNLMKKFKLSDLQSDAILQMRLQRLAGLEQENRAGAQEIKAFIKKECDTILADPKKVDAIMVKELTEIREKYGDDRHCGHCAARHGQLSAKRHDSGCSDDCGSHNVGLREALKPSPVRAQNREVGGESKGMTTKEEDEILSLLSASNHDDLLYFTSTGRVFSWWSTSCRRPVVSPKAGDLNLLQVATEAKVAAVLKAKLEGKKHLFMSNTSKGTVKLRSSDFQNIRRSGLIARKFPDGDELKWVVATTGNDEIFILSKKVQGYPF